MRVDHIHLLADDRQHLLPPLDILAKLQNWLVSRRLVSALVDSLNCVRRSLSCAFQLVQILIDAVLLLRKRRPPLG